LLLLLLLLLARRGTITSHEIQLFPFKWLADLLYPLLRIAKSLIFHHRTLLLLLPLSKAEQEMGGGLDRVDGLRAPLPLAGRRSR
jgi:hypothetical protein